MDNGETPGYNTDLGRTLRPRAKEISVGVFNGLFPVLEGKEDAARSFANEAGGQRRDQLGAHLVRSNVTRETWSLLATPMGSFINVWFEGDVEAAFTDLATNNDEFGVWMRESILDVTGVDVSQPNDSTPPEAILDWKA